MRTAVLLSVFVAATCIRADETRVYGVCTHVSRTEFAERDRLFAAAREAGFTSMRTDCDWRALEKTPGTWDFSRFDSIVDGAAAAGMTVLPILYGPPDGVRVWEDGRWSGFVRRFAERYRGRIPAVEIWNEQNAGVFWGTTPNPTNYCRALQAAYAAVKAVAPGMKVSIGGFGGVPFEFIEGVYAAGAASAFDAMSVHPYDVHRTPEAALEKRLTRLRALMARYGDEKKELWVTEMGWETRPCTFTVPSIMTRGVDLAFPGTDPLKAVYTDFYLTLGAHRRDRPFFGAVAEALPRRVTLDVCRPAELETVLSGKGAPDIVVLPPFDERYPAGTLDALYGFVRRGGLLVDFGGAPMFRASKVDESVLGDPLPPSWAPARRFGIGSMADGTGCHFDDTRLLPGVTFHPLHTTSFSNGVPRVNAALYRFGGRGGVLVSGIREKDMSIPVSEYGQMKFLPRTMLIMRACGVSSVWWYNLRARDYDWKRSHYGILHSDFTAKPAFAAMKAFIALCPPDARMRADRAWRTGGDYSPEWTRRDGTSAGALWTVGAPRNVRIVFSSAAVRFLDAEGRPLPPEKVVRDGAAISLRLCDEVVYFEGASVVAPCGSVAGHQRR